MTEQPRTAPEMDPRFVDDCKEVGREMLKGIDCRRGVDPEWLAVAVGSFLGARGWIRKRRATIEPDEIDAKAVLDRNPVVYATAEIVGGEPESTSA